MPNLAHPLGVLYENSFYLLLVDNEYSKSPSFPFAKKDERGFSSAVLYRSVLELLCGRNS